MMYNRYHGNTGKVTRVAEPSDKKEEHRVNSEDSTRNSPSPEDSRRDKNPSMKKQGSASAFSKGLGGILKKFDISQLEFEDILLMLVLYLLYRESGDDEMLIMLGAMLLL